MIRVKNIYYMLAYAFQALNSQRYKNIATEKFQNIGELMAAILIKGIEQQVKRGLGKEYIARTAAISKERKKALRKLLVYFDEVEALDLHAAQWNIRYDRNNQSYRMVVSICYLIAKGLLQTQTDGKTKLMDFLDEQRMHRLYEKFILAYYRREFPQIKANPSQVSWQLDDDVQDMLPTMQTDIMLEYGDKTLIIDTKYYSRTTQQRYGIHTLHSGNLYQIFTYVKNKEAELSEV